MDHSRLIVGLPIFLIATFATGVVLWFVLLVLGFAFGASTPECTDSDTCSAWGDFLYHPWPGQTVCFLLSGLLLAWPFRRFIRR